VRTEPRTAPYRRNASSAKREHVGSKRQARGRTGPSTSWYARTNGITAPANPGDSGSGVGPEIEGFRELGSHLGMGKSLCTGLRDHHDVGRGPDTRLAVAERFAQQPLHSIAYDRVSDSFADRHTETGPRTAGGSPDHDEMRGVPPVAVTLDDQVLRTAREPRLLRETPVFTQRSPRLLRRDADRQPLSSLVAPSLEDGPATGGRHAGAESMRSFPTTIARLIRSLHRSPGWVRKPRIRTHDPGKVNFRSTTPPELRQPPRSAFPDSRVQSAPRSGHARRCASCIPRRSTSCRTASQAHRASMRRSDGDSTPCHRRRGACTPIACTMRMGSACDSFSRSRV